MSKQVRQFDARNVLEALIQVGDAFMRVGQRYADEDGRMSEQFHRYVSVSSLIFVVIFETIDHLRAKYAYVAATSSCIGLMGCKSGRVA